MSRRLIAKERRFLRPKYRYKFVDFKRKTIVEEDRTSYSNLWLQIVLIYLISMTSFGLILGILDYWYEVGGLREQITYLYAAMSVGFVYTLYKYKLALRIDKREAIVNSLENEKR